VADINEELSMNGGVIGPDGEEAPFFLFDRNDRKTRRSDMT